MFKRGDLVLLDSVGDPGYICLVLAVTDEYNDKRSYDCAIIDELGRQKEIRLFGPRAGGHTRDMVIASLPPGDI